MTGRPHPLGGAATGFCGRFTGVAGLADRLQIGQLVRPTDGPGDNVVDVRRSGDPTICQAQSAEPAIAGQHLGAQLAPRCPVPTFGARPPTTICECTWTGAGVIVAPPPGDRHFVAAKGPAGAGGGLGQKKRPQRAVEYQDADFIHHLSATCKPSRKTCGIRFVPWESPSYAADLLSTLR